MAEDKRIYVGEFFHREPVTYQVHVFTDMMGNTKEVHDDDFEDEEGPMIDQGFEYSECIEFETYEVTKYIVSGQEILETTLVPGEFIPVVPAYGERAFVEGEEHYEGITRLSKDPPRQVTHLKVTQALGVFRESCDAFVVFLTFHKSPFTVSRYNRNKLTGHQRGF